MSRARDVLDRFALVKLNGGLATSMGLEQPKSLLEAREGRTFLQVIVGQILALRERHGIRLPLVLMDSEATQATTLAALADHPELPVDGLPLDFLQSMIPKLERETLAPVSWPAAPALEWCPPGHGDIYGSLRSSGMLAALLERGFHYAMISNADNLGSAFDPRIAGHVAAGEIPFLMEVVEGTEADRKGGHIARRRSDGRLVLRETAQTPPEDEESFRDYRRWRYYNTNSLWVDLRALERTLDAQQGVLELPLIVNRKTVDPRDGESTPVIQLESAMGAAIGSFTGAALLRVPRTRFAPVKTTDDLLLLRSDAYRLSPRAAGGARGRSAAVRRAGQAVLRAARPVRAALSGRPAVVAGGATSRGPRRRDVRGRRRHPGGGGAGAGCADDDPRRRDAQRLMPGRLPSCPGGRGRISADRARWRQRAGAGEHPRIV